MKPNGDGTSIVKNIYVILILCGLLISITSNVVQYIGIGPVKEKVIELKNEADIKHTNFDNRLHVLETAVQVQAKVREQQYKEILRRLDIMDGKLP